MGRLFKKYSACPIFAQTIFSYRLCVWKGSFKQTSCSNRTCMCLAVNLLINQAINDSRQFHSDCSFNHNFLWDAGDNLTYSSSSSCFNSRRWLKESNKYLDSNYFDSTCNYLQCCTTLLAAFKDRERAYDKIWKWKSRRQKYKLRIIRVVISSNISNGG